MEIPFFTFFVGGLGTLLLRSTNTTLLEMMETQIDLLKIQQYGSVKSFLALTRWTSFMLTQSTWMSIFFM